MVPVKHVIQQEKEHKLWLLFRKERVTEPELQRATIANNFIAIK